MGRNWVGKHAIVLSNLGDVPTFAFVNAFLHLRIQEVDTTSYYTTISVWSILSGLPYRDFHLVQN